MQNEIFLEVNNIKKQINLEFPLLNVNAYENFDDIVISISDKEIYYSDNYQMLISEININHLWPKKIMNVIFIFSEDEIYQTNLCYNPGLISKNIVGPWIYKQTPVSFSGSEISCELLEAA